MKKERLIREEEKLNKIIQIFNKENFNNNFLKKEIKEYYVCIICFIEKEKYQKYLIESELNELDYIYYREIENRKWYKIFWSIFKLNCDFLNTFFIFNIYKDYRINAIKIITYFNSILLSLVVDVCFYHDETMHKIYEENGKYNFKYKLPYIFLSDIVTIAATYLFDKIIDIQDDLIELKINIDNNEKEKQAMNICKKFRRNRIIFYIISIVLQFFIWYFISCFFSVYINTQIYLLIDFLIGLSLSLLNLIFRSTIIFIIKIIAVKCINNYNKFLHCMFIIINKYKILNTIFECIIEGIIMLILKI